MNTEKTVNGVAVDQLAEKAAALKENPDLASFKFHAKNQWVNCGQNETTIETFYGVGEEHRHATPFALTADEPPVLLGGDEGPNPVEYLLTALVSCLTSSLVYHAAIRGIRVERVESEIEGDLDVRGFMGLEKDVPKGYKNIRVTFRVTSDASPEKLKECAGFSPVFHTLTEGVDVDLTIDTD